MLVLKLPLVTEQALGRPGSRFLAVTHGTSLPFSKKCSVPCFQVGRHFNHHCHK